MQVFVVFRQYASGYAELNRKKENKPRKRIGFNVQNKE
jgi:hypothetical protein